MTRFGAAFLVAGLALSACGDDDGPNTSFSDWAAERRAQIDIVCDCAEELGFDGPQDCVAAQEHIGSSQETCAREAIEQSAEATGTLQTCYLPLQRTLSDCVDQRLRCSSDDSIDPCLEDFQVGARACEPWPSGVSRDLDGCGVEPQELVVVRLVCEETCMFSDDGDCDDGGDGSMYDECALGSDCADCGERLVE